MKVIVYCRLSGQCTGGARSVFIGKSSTHVLTVEITIRRLSEW